MYPLAARPADQPITGVIASTVPNITPVRRASPKLGRCSRAPLPRAAANASDDMLKARSAIARGVIAESAGLTQHASRNRPEQLWVGTGLAKQNSDSLPTAPRAEARVC